MSIKKILRRAFAAALVIAIMAPLSGCGGGGSASKLISQGDGYLLDMDYSRALLQFDKAIKAEPKTEHAYIGAAGALVGLGRDYEAAEILRQGLAEAGDTSKIEEILVRLGSVAGSDAEQTASPPPTKAATTPKPSSAALPSQAATPPAASSPAPSPSRAPSPPPTVKPTQSAAPAGSQTHIVEKGDSLGSIAKKYYADADKWPIIRDANNISGEILQIGQKLIIPAIDGAATPTPTAAPTTVTPSPTPTASSSGATEPPAISVVPSEAPAATPTAAPTPAPASSDFEIKDGVLVKYKGGGKAVSIPSGVTSIGDYAFNNCETVTSIVIPNGVKSIKIGAFNGCSSLMSITIPGSVEVIAGTVFARCPTGLVIYAPDNSFAETYAHLYGLNYSEL